MKALWVILILAIIVIAWLFIDFRFGHKKHKPAVRTFPERRGSLTLFTSGQDLFDEYFRDAERAKHHIHILFYIVKKDKISYRFLKLLKKKALSGVEVKLMVDWSGSMSLNKAMIGDLKKSGVKVAICKKPKFPFFFYTAQQRNHRKITIIDGAVGYLGGFNVAKEYVDLDPKLSPWRDYHLRISGEAVGDLEDIFLNDWKEASGEDIGYKEYYKKEGLSGNTTVRIVPTEADATLEDQFIRLFKKAKQSVIIGTPYFIPSPALMDELKNLLANGVGVKIIVPAVSDHPLVKEAAYRYFRELLSLGAEIRQFQQGFFHAKYILIDDSFLDIGTANFDKRSLFLNDEVNCFTSDQAFITEVKKAINYDIENSTNLTSKDLQSIGLLARLKEKVASAVDSFL
ncbi:MAG: cardiolipin synthase [Bacillus sp. (in: firmicutes)]